MELVVDPNDHVPHMAALMRKLPAGAQKPAQSFAAFPVTHRDVRTGAFEDLASCANMVELWAKGPRAITFYD